MNDTIPSSNSVRVLRAGRQWSQADLAGRAGISQAAVSAIEVERLSPSVATAHVRGMTNRAAGGTYYVLSSMNAVQPLNQWTPVAAILLTGNGNFSITATNEVNAGAPWQQFFVLQTQ